MPRKVPTLDVMPYATNVRDILADLYILKDEIKDDMTYHGANYVVIRLVTIFERLLKILAIPSTNIEDKSTVTVDVTTLRTILEERAEPTDTIKRIMAEAGSYQNINAVEEYFRHHKPVSDIEFNLTYKEKKNLDKLFKLRHRLTHTVDAIEINSDHLSVFYETISKLTMRLACEYTQLSEPFLKGEMYQVLKMDDVGKTCFEETVRLYESKFPKMKKISAQDISEYCWACLEIDKPKQALPLFDKLAELNPNAPLFYMMHGIIFAELGHYKDAVEAFSKGLETAPNNSGLLFEMTEAQFELGNTERALECALRTLFTPNDILDSYFWLSKIYDKLGKEEIAKMLSNYSKNENYKMFENQHTMSKYMPEPL